MRPADSKRFQRRSSKWKREVAVEDRSNFRSTLAMRRPLSVISMSAIDRSRALLPHLFQPVREGLAVGTYAAYRRALELFLLDRNLTFPFLRLLSVESIDRKFKRYLRRLFLSVPQGSMQSGENARNALHLWIPRTKNRLCESHTILRYWARGRVQQARPPIPRNIATLVALSLARRGHILPAVAVLLSFDCYLRINECLSLTKADVTIPHDERLGGDVHEKTTIHLRKTKTLDNLSCMVRDPVVARLLHRIVDSLPSPSSRIFPFSAGEYREFFFKGTLRRLGLDHLHFVPHSLRHGGATHDFVIEGQSLDYIKRRGRWASADSVGRYVQQLAAVDLTFKVPSKSDRQGAVFHEHLEYLMDLCIDDSALALPTLPSLPPEVSDRRL